MGVRDLLITVTPHLLRFLATLPVYWLALARITRLVTEDKVFERPRSALWAFLADHRRPQLLYLSSCRWCASIWLSIPTLLIAYYHTSNPLVLIPAAALAGSYVTGFLAGHEGG